MNTFIIPTILLATQLPPQDKPPMEIAQCAPSQQQAALEQSPEHVRPYARANLITLTAKEFEEYTNTTLDRAETYYNNRLNSLLWIIGVLVAIALAVIGILVPLLLERHRRKVFTEEIVGQSLKMHDELSRAKDDLRNELAVQMDSRERTETQRIASNLSAMFTMISGLAMSASLWELMLLASKLAVRSSFSATCVRDCWRASRFQFALTTPHIVTQIGLETLRELESELDNWKSSLDEILADDERAYMKDQFAQLLKTVHIVMHGKEEATKHNTPENDS